MVEPIKLPVIHVEHWGDDDDCPCCGKQLRAENERLCADTAAFLDALAGRMLDKGGVQVWREAAECRAMASRLRGET